jgi:hypothetical protein
MPLLCSVYNAGKLRALCGKVALGKQAARLNMASSIGSLTGMLYRSSAAGGTAISEDISFWWIVARQGAHPYLVFSHNLIYLRNPRCAGYWFSTE